MLLQPRSRSQVKSITGTYTALVTDELIFASSSGAAFTLTLPPVANCKGKSITIVKTDSSTNLITLSGSVTTVRLKTQYEVCHMANNGTSWYPVNRNFNGTPTTYIPTIGGSVSAPTKATTKLVDLAYWWRIGTKYMGIHYDYRHGNSSGAADGSGTYLFPLPSGFTIDTAVQAAADSANLSYAVVGPAQHINNSARGVGFVHVYDTNNLAMSGIYDGGGLGLTQLIGSGYFSMTNAIQNYSFTAIVPITEFD